MQRLRNIDVLKFIGLFCIILAHVSPPSIIFQIRNFDVVLMIIISTYLYFVSKKENIKFNNYLLKRIKRLLLPTYLFLAIFYICAIIVNPSWLTLEKIMDSFLLHDGIGYVWIIRIYLITAILLPIIDYFCIKHNLNMILFLNVILFIVYEFFCQIGIFKLNIYFEDVIAYLVPCISIIVVTYWLMNNNYKKIALFSVINLVIFVLLATIIYKVTGQIQNTNYAKYPFRLYYLSYAFGISGFLIIIGRNKLIVDILYNKFIAFVSKSSLWIYLWHILFIYIIDFYFNSLNWIMKYTIIILCACFVTYIQNGIVENLERKKINKEILKIFKG